MKTLRFLSILALLLLVRANSFSQIIYKDVVPDSTTNTWAAFNFHLSKNYAVGYGDTGTITIWFHPFNPNEVKVVAWTNCEVMVNNTTSKLPLKLIAGDSIKSNKNWFAVSYADLNTGNTQGLWLGGVTDRFMGVRFKLNKFGPWLYGWVRMDVDATPTMFMVKDYAYNSSTTANFILAGEGMPSGIKTIVPPNSLMLYPNPSKGIFNIELPVSMQSTSPIITIYDVLGNIIYENSLSNKSTLDLSAKGQGLYFYTIKGKGAADLNGKLLVY